ncbi:hypothetical protein M1466_01750 [Candidatus Dependentiae bacterium]|nr:hypothetical protein [Candidatus Dependentiae bacterium]
MHFFNTSFVEHFAKEFIWVIAFAWWFFTIVPLMGLELPWSTMTAVNVGIVTLSSVIFLVLVIDNIAALFGLDFLNAKIFGDWLKKLRMLTALALSISLVVIAIRYADTLQTVNMQYMYPFFLGVFVLWYTASNRTKI